jgi:hypothetical protein
MLLTPRICGRIQTKSLHEFVGPAWPGGDNTGDPKRDGDRQAATNPVNDRPRQIEAFLLKKPLAVLVGGHNLYPHRIVRPRSEEQECVAEFIFLEP